MPGEPDEVGHIVVVDDDVMVRQTITNYLEEHNVRAASVSSRQDLSRHLKKAHPSLILLDLRLGQEDGLEVLKEIRSHSHVPIIIMTGHSREEVDRIVGLELGADDYLAKRPLTLSSAERANRARSFSSLKTTNSFDSIDPMATLSRSAFGGPSSGYIRAPLRGLGRTGDI